jgi:ADYC domain/Pentapeptide repeats (8 copies)
MKRQRFGPSLALPLMVGCAPGPDGPGEPDDSFEGVPADATELEPADLNPNGTSLNGTSLNGTSLNGTNLTGVTLNSVSLSGVTIGGVAVTGVALSATNFSGTKSGSAVSGAGFVGAIFVGTLSNASTLKLRVDSRTQLTGANTDVYAYDVSYETTSGWKPLCGSTTVKSVPVNGTWDQRQGVTGGGGFTSSSTTFTFGCRQHAVAKCVELGYKPWKTVGGTLLKNHHLACVRMVRADYCGDGKSWTVDNTIINVYDNKGVQSDTQAWTVEADWTPSGARYVTTTTHRRYLQLGSTVPSCIATKASSSTGNAGNWSSGTLIMNEY